VLGVSHLLCSTADLVNVHQALMTFDQIGQLHWLACCLMGWPLLCVYSDWNYSNLSDTKILLSW